MDLRRFGFTLTESRVYLALLKLPQATGYAVAREAGLARANAYGALERLAARGMVSRLPGRPARYVAVDPAAMTARLERDWKQDMETLSRQLAAVERRDAQPAALPSHELLGDGAALLECLARSARGAREELLAVVGPWASDCFAELARVRTARVSRILSLGAPAPEGAQVRQLPAREIASYWGGLPVALVADRRIAVLGLFSAGDLASGVVTNHPAEVPFIRHLLRRELAAVTPQRVS